MSNKLSSTDHNFLCKYARNGGSVSATGDYSGATTSFTIAPPGDDVWLIYRLLVHIQDSGTFDAEKYGNGITLTNGIEVKIYRDGVERLDLTDGVPVLDNSHWARLCYDFKVLSEGNGDEVGGVRWTFSEPLGLDGSENDELRIELNDNFTGLTSHAFLAQGIVLVDDLV